MSKKNLSKKMLMAATIAGAFLLSANAGNADPTNVSTWDELKTGLTSGSNMNMTGNIEVPEVLSVSGKNNTIIMNGKTLSGQAETTTGLNFTGNSTLNLTGGGTISGFYRPDTNPTKVDGTEYGILDIRSNSNLTISGENDNWTFSENTSGVGSINALNSSISANVNKIVFDGNVSNAQGAGLRHQISDNTYIDNSASIVANEIIFNNNEI